MLLVSCYTVPANKHILLKDKNALHTAIKESVDPYGDLEWNYWGSDDEYHYLEMKINRTVLQQKYHLKRYKISKSILVLSHKFSYDPTGSTIERIFEKQIRSLEKAHK